MTEDKARSLIALRLQPGEKLIWFDTPPPWSAVWNGPLIQLLSALFFLSFATFWSWGASHATTKSAPAPFSFFPLFGLVFIGIGAYQLVSALRAVSACWGTVYGLTNRRVIVAVGENGPTKSYGPDALARLERTGSDSRGTLSFDFGPYGRRGNVTKFRSALVDIRDPGKVEAAIYATLLKPEREGALS